LGASRLLSRLVARLPHDLPDLPLGPPGLPRRHHGAPRRGFPGEPRPPLRDPPEEVRLLEHRDRAGILEIRRGRIEALREVALTVEVVAVAVHAVADVGLA